MKVKSKNCRGNQGSISRQFCVSDLAIHRVLNRIPQILHLAASQAAIGSPSGLTWKANTTEMQKAPSRNAERFRNKIIFICSDLAKLCQTDFA